MEYETEQKEESMRDLLLKERKSLIQEMKEYSGHDERYKRIVQRIKEIDLLLMPTENRTVLELQEALIEENYKKLNSILNKLERAMAKMEEKQKPEHWWQDDSLFRWTELLTVKIAMPVGFLWVWASLESDGMVRMKIANLVSRLFKV